MEERDVVVVGAGHNGLACAALLAQRGLDVLVLEQRDVAGGAVATEELVEGFRFSTGAQVAHLLHERVVAELGLDLAPLELRAPEPRLAVLPDGSVFREGATPEETAERLKAFSREDARAYGGWVADWEDVASLIDRFLLAEAPSSDELRAAAVVAGAADTLGRFATRSVADLLAETFEADETRTLFGPFLPGDPQLPGSPLAYAYFTTARFRDPACNGEPRGGMGALAQAFAAAAAAAGAEVRLSTPVERIVVNEGKAVGVDDIRARAVVSNADPKRTFLRLVGTGALPPGLAQQIVALETDPPSAKLHCALAGEPDLTRLGDGAGLAPIHVYRRDGAFPLVLQIPSLVDETLAPAGSHTLSIFAADAAELALEPVAALIPNLEEITVATVLLGPAELEARLGLTGGCIHHITHLPAQSFVGRGRPATPVPGLFLCGAGIHPGGEVTGVPGWNAAQAVLAAL